MDKLFSGSMDGTLAVFQLTAEGYDFECVYVFDQHKSAITGIDMSWSHLYTSSDDGSIRVWCLTTYSLGDKNSPGGLQILYEPQVRHR